MAEVVAMPECRGKLSEEASRWTRQLSVTPAKNRPPRPQALRRSRKPCRGLCRSLGMGHRDKITCTALCDLSESNLKGRSEQLGGVSGMFQDWRIMLPSPATSSMRSTSVSLTISTQTQFSPPPSAGAASTPPGRANPHASAGREFAP